MCDVFTSSSNRLRLPEIPPDTAETNVVMRTEDLPEFSQITPSKCVAACAKLAIEYETKLERHLESLKGLFFFFHITVKCQELQKILLLISKVLRKRKMSFVMWQAENCFTNLECRGFFFIIIILTLIQKVLRVKFRLVSIDAHLVA